VERIAVSGRSALCGVEFSSPNAAWTRARASTGLSTGRARGKLLAARARRPLLDPGTPFLELSPLAAFGMYDDDGAGAGIVTGIGRVEGANA
jgi:acetyl-CoA carboxylase carboxyltransferase component